MIERRIAQPEESREMKAQWAAVALALLLGVTAAAQDTKLGKPAAEDQPAQGSKLQLSDGKYPLWEIRPLDRRVYVISLDGVWKRPAAPGAAYQLTVRFPNGQTYTHRPITDALFFRGEMRFMVPEYMLVRTKAARGGKLELFVTERGSADAKPEVISNTVEVPWPLKRQVVRRAPAIKATPARPVDAFPLPDEDEKVPPPGKKGEDR
jgi:hypothetical protein